MMSARARAVLPKLAMSQHLHQQWKFKIGDESTSHDLLPQLGEAEHSQWQLLLPVCAVCHLGAR